MMKNKFSKLWVAVITVVSILVKYIGEFSISSKAGFCRMGGDMFVDGCGWVKLANGSLTVIAIASLIYFVYYNFEAIKEGFYIIVEKLKKD